MKTVHHIRSHTVSDFKVQATLQCVDTNCTANLSSRFGLLYFRPSSMSKVDQIKTLAATPDGKIQLVQKKSVGDNEAGVRVTHPVFVPQIFISSTRICPRSGRLEI